ncbi:hypothetical protein POTOM_011718 [Populus tomentosa]|uniref:Uncharacterized protein n=1 Tax=Populus tomentosa TaxID=118781 RepID=A0A8X8AJL8_POPTO|nr:hypothetical protein POTOM_011718 [Populus tomentosa]
MNVQAHLSGQVSNQLPPQQNGNQQMQNLAASANAPANMLIIDPELCRARNLIHQKIFEIIMRRHSQPVDDTQKQKFKGTAKRLEEGLFKAAQTKGFVSVIFYFFFNLRCCRFCFVGGLFEPEYLRESPE